MPAHAQTHRGPHSPRAHSIAALHPSRPRCRPTLLRTPTHLSTTLRRRTPLVRLNPCAAWRPPARPLTPPLVCRLAPCCRLVAALPLGSALGRFQFRLASLPLCSPAAAWLRSCDRSQAVYAPVNTCNCAGFAAALLPFTELSTQQRLFPDPSRARVQWLRRRLRFVRRRHPLPHSELRKWHLLLLVRRPHPLHVLYLHLPRQCSRALTRAALTLWPWCARLLLQRSWPPRRRWTQQLTLLPASSRRRRGLEMTPPPSPPAASMARRREQFPRPCCGGACGASGRSASAPRPLAATFPCARTPFPAPWHVSPLHNRAAGGRGPGRAMARTLAAL